MPTSESNITIRESAELDSSAGFSARSENVLASESSAIEDLSARWNEVIDHKLIEWGKWLICGDAHDGLVDEGIVGPSFEAIQKAYKLISFMRKQFWDLPTGIIPDGEGGVVFENRQGRLYQRIEIGENGEMFLVTFEDGKRLDRSQIEVE